MTSFHKRGIAGQRGTDTCPVSHTGWQQARPNSHHLLDSRPRAALPQALPPPHSEDDTPHISLHTSGAGGGGHGPEGKAWWQSTRGIDERCVCPRGWMFEAAPLFRS